MLKRILSIIISTILVSSMAVVAGASTKTEWVENFDSYVPTDFYADAKSESEIWVLTTECSDHTAYAIGEGGHYHLNDGWTMQSRDFQAGSYAAYNAWTLKSGEHGKKNSDKSLFADYLYYCHRINLKNNFDGSPVDLSTGKAVGFSFDWYDASSQDHTSHKNLDRYIEMTVTLGKEGADDIADETIRLGKISYDTLTSAVGTTNATLGRESWNDFAMYVSKDKVLMQGKSGKTELSFNISDYDPSTDAWTSGANTGYYIKSVNSAEVWLYGGTGKAYRQNGIDNLKVCIENSMPASIADKQMPVFTNFASAQYTKLGGGSYGGLLLGDNYSAHNALVKHIGLNTEWNNIITATLYNDDADTAKTLGTDGVLKVSAANPATQPSYYDAEYKLGLDLNNTLGAATGDKVQLSTDFKIIGDAAASSTEPWFSVDSNFAADASGTVINIAGDGTVFEKGQDTQYAKLKQNTWYSLDVLFELTSAGTVATVYIDGAEVLTKTVNGAQYTARGIPSAFMTVHARPATGEEAKVAANTLYLDNVCYQIFKNGKGAYNFNKNLNSASNNVIKMAEEDFVNGVIAPIADTWTAAKFNALGLANCTVVDSSSLEAVADAAALLKDNKIKITGDYGKEMYYTVSSEGATKLSEDYMVIAKQDNVVLSNDGDCKAGTEITTFACDSAGTDNIIFTAEYNSKKELVKVVEGAYAPVTPGNTVKIFAWTDTNTLKPITPKTTLTVVSAE